MPIKVACLECNRVYELPDAAAGRKGKCECGAILDVPAVKPREPKPPRTLAEAAAIVEEAKRPTINASGVAKLANESRETRSVEGSDPDIVADESVPPPLPAFPPDSPSAYHSDGPPPDTIARAPSLIVESRYSDLRKLVVTVYVLGELILVLSMLIAAASIVLAFVVVRVDENGKVFVLSIGVAVCAAAFGFFWKIVLSAASQLIQVMIDTEENSRKTSILIERIAAK